MGQCDLVKGIVTTLGNAASLLKALYVSRNRHGHAEVTAAALYVLMYKAYNAYTEGVDQGEEPKSFSDWRKQAELESPQFHSWSLTLYLKLTTLIFVQSLSEEHFELYMNACQSLSPWYFFFRQHHYARWLSVHIRDMECIETEIPAIAAEFKNSNFEVNKTSRAFSLLPVDQAHEQNSKISKGN